MSTAPAPALAASSAVEVAVRVPAAFFSIVLGLGGLASAWRGAARAYAVSPWLADALLVLSAVIWVIVFAAQVLKVITAREKLAAELAHPVQGSQAALGPASLLLIAAGTTVHYRELAEVLFWIGAAAQLAFGVWIVGRWFGAAVEPKLVTPAMYLPPVAGNLLAAIAAGAVGRTDLGWLFFGAGVVSWLVLAPVLLARYLTAGELPAALRPLLGIEIAPPAVALLAWQALDRGGPDVTARVLFGVALFVALVVLRLAGRYRDVPFTPAYWAFSFPLAALAGSALRLASGSPRSVAAALALPLFVVANAVIAAIAYRTLLALGRGKLLPPA
jgi:tellurite resistance protein